MSSVESLKALRSSVQSSRSSYKKRRDAVKKPYDNAFKMDDYYSKIKKAVSDCTSELGNGIVGMSATLDVKCSSINDHSEKQCLTLQSGFSQALTYMANEISRCQEKMDYYDGRIASYGRQIKEQGGVILPWD